MRAVLAFIACLALASCTSAPTLPPSLFGVESRGLSLDAMDAVVVHVSNLWVPAGRPAGEPDQNHGAAIEPAGDLEALRKDFVSGFRDIKPKSRILPVDEQVATACFTPAGLAEREPWNEPVRPNFDSPGCRVALQFTRPRYLISVHGWVGAESKTSSGANVYAVGALKEVRHHFQVAATVFDVAEGKQICADRDFEYAEGNLVAGIFLMPAPLPVPVPLIWGIRVDAEAYWKRVAWHAGARTAHCFVAPTS